jgi:hypothetical protein
MFMEPLDLTKRPPRSPREKLAGLAFLARTVDKMRAALPGGNLGVYNNGHVGASAVALQIVGIKPEDLQAVVAGAASEEEIAAWVREHTDPSKIEEANRIIVTRSPKDFPPEQRARFEAAYPQFKDTPDVLLVDVLEADDAAIFAREHASG